MNKWKTNNIPDLSGKTAIVTGGNIGLGYQIVLELAKKNANVIIACRTKSKGLKAIEKIEQSLNRRMKLDVIELDLTNLHSIRAFASEISQKYHQLDILINNAGVVNLANREETRDGYEMQMAINHFGHFALTGLLIPIIRKTPNSRVVTMSSLSYKFGNIDFDDLNWRKRSYDRAKSYGDSKLANMLFTMELQRYFEEHNISAISVAAHPGLSATERQQSIGMGGRLSKMIAQSVEMGALPALMAGTAPQVKGGELFGPRWLIRGYPTKEKVKPAVYDKKLSEKLWKTTEQITGIVYN
ncbi:oxidoreductase [Lysinibacillus xylanilyticus]|uniref:oxidoreductase n=1 Tax=Lysinibacillus xylanilyticus TaxID=582475 RepID=UPI0038308E6D